MSRTCKREKFTFYAHCLVSANNERFESHWTSDRLGIDRRHTCTIAKETLQQKPDVPPRHPRRCRNTCREAEAEFPEPRTGIENRPSTVCFPAVDMYAVSLYKNHVSTMVCIISHDWGFGVCFPNVFGFFHVKRSVSGRFPGMQTNRADKRKSVSNVSVFMNSP